jgi:hypothetical protein
LINFSVRHHQTPSEHTNTVAEELAARHAVRQEAAKNKKKAVGDMRGSSKFICAGNANGKCGSQPIPSFRGAP